MDLDALIAMAVRDRYPVEVSVMRDDLTPPGVEEELGVIFTGLKSQKRDGTYHAVYVCRGMTGPNREATATAIVALWNAARPASQGA